MKHNPILRAVLLAAAFLPLSLQTLSAQTRTVSGRVSDAEGEPLPGAAIMITGTVKGTTTEIDGSYKFTVPTGDVSLTFTFIGMKEKTILVKASQSTVNVTLQTDTQLEAAVVNAGYGVIQKKENFTGSAFEVTREDLKLKTADRIDKMLVGMVPGLSVLEDNSTGRSTIKIRIRGDGSLSASNEPLWIIDGVPEYTGTRTNSVTGTSYTVSPLSFINPDDIESITILKDASTTSIYGGNGSNGVILVTTRNAESGRTSCNASIKYGISTVDRSTTMRYVSGSQWLDLAKEGWTNSGRPIEAFPYQDNEHNSYSTTDTDWFKVYYGVGQTEEVNFSASTGGKRMDNFMSLSYFGSTSPVKGINQNRYSITNRSTIKFGEKLKAEAKLAGTYNDSDIFSISSTYLSVIPIFSPYNEDGSMRLYNWYSTSDTEYSLVQKKFVYNKVPEREENDNHQTTLEGRASLNVTYKPFKDLTITSLSSGTFLSTYEATYSASTNLGGMSSTGNNGYSRRSGVFNTNLLQNIRANYHHGFGEKMDLSAMAAIEWTDSRHPYLNATGSGFINDHIKEVTYANSDTKSGESNVTHSRSLSYIAHGSFTYDNRYTLTASYRREGNSSFSEFARWMNVGSVGLLWNIKREPFFNVKSIDTFSLKASYGTNGNSRIDSSSSYGSYTLSTGSYYGGIAGSNQASPANPGLSWETTYIFNTGINFGMFKRISATLDYYNRTTKNVLYSGRVSSVITDGSVLRNVGEITNHGVEFTFDARIIESNTFNWGLHINGASNKNIISKLYKGMHTGFFNQIWTEGASKDAYWLVRWAGVDPTTGAPMWYDYDGNLTYSFSYNDRVLLPQYSNLPKLRGGVSNDFSYGRLNLRIMFDYAFGGYEYSTAINDDGTDIIGENAPVEELDHWRNPGETAVNPSFIYKSGRSSYFNTTRNLYKSDYVQLTTLSLGYMLPDKWASAINMNSVNVSFVGDNIYLWTPGQSRYHNSYKTIKYGSGLRRGLSLKVNMNF